MAINKVVYGNQTLIDITDTTALASDVAQGKEFYGPDGNKVVGTASGGITPTGTIAISQNGTYDVTNYASANVNVSGGSDTRVLKIIDNNLAKSMSAGETQRTFKFDDDLIRYIKDDTIGIEAVYGGSLSISIPNSSHQASTTALMNQISFLIFNRYNSTFGASFSCYTNADFYLETDLVLKPSAVLSLTIYGNYSSKFHVTGSIYVPDNLVSSYKTATNWTRYANNIKPISEWEYYGIY